MSLSQQCNYRAIYCSARLLAISIKHYWIVYLCTCLQR